MFKISSKVSCMLSIAMAIAFMLILIFGAVIMPWLANVLIDLPDNVGSRNEIAEFERIFVLILAYLVIGFMTLADGMLLNLLYRVRAGLVFTAKSIGLIRGVSWCAILLGITFLILGIYFQLAFFAAFACIFLGICIRVVKNVIEQATEIKAENDFTI